ncbi:MAG: sugar ABC transporter ATP-binding protein [Gaiellales bacterium]
MTDPPSNQGGSRPRLRVTGLSKRYGSVQALSEVSFELRRGEVMALLGENGAGKSTLVKILAGLVQPDEGTIELDDEPADLFPSARSQAAGVAVVHQEYTSVPQMTVAENLVLGRRDSGRVWVPWRLARRARALLPTVGLEGVDPRTPVERLTVAEQQLLEIARVLARDAKILIFDEPTAALADREIERVLDVIKRLAAEGTSIVYVTHRLPEVFRVADRVTVFRNGRSLEPVSTGDIDVDGVIKMMLGRELQTMFPPRNTATDEIALEVDGLLAPGLARPVSFSARKGEIIGLTGQLGSGASATVQALAGRLPGVEGRVAAGSAQLSLRSHHAVMRKGVVYCSADRKRDGTFLGKPIRENLSSPWLASVSPGGWISGRRERRRAREIGEGFAIDVARLEAPVGTLSGGNQQKVALGKWLGMTPSLMLVEEPTRGVDIGARAEIYQRLRDLCSEGMTIVVSSSDTAEVLGLCDTIATFYRGRMSAIRRNEEWTEEALAREVMHTEAEVL